MRIGLADNKMIGIVQAPKAGHRNIGTDCTIGPVLCAHVGDNSPFVFLAMS